MAAGYISTIDERYEDAAKWYDKASKISANQKIAQAQLRLLKMINSIGSAKRIDIKKENELLAEIEWLRGLDTNALPDFRHYDAMVWVKKTMASKYKQQNEWVKSECFSTNTNFYTDNSKIELFKSFLAKSNKTAYEKMLESLSVKKMDDLLAFQAIQLAYGDNINEAIEKMEKQQLLLPMFF
jgi:hypothetical protein